MSVIAVVECLIWKVAFWAYYGDGKDYHNINKYYKWILKYKNLLCFVFNEYCGIMFCFLDWETCYCQVEDHYDWNFPWH